MKAAGLGWWSAGYWTGRPLAAAWIGAPDWATGWRRYAKVDAAPSAEANAEASGKANVEARSAEVRDTNIQTLRSIPSGRRRDYL